MKIFIISIKYIIAHFLFYRKVNIINYKSIAFIAFIAFITMNFEKNIIFKFSLRMIYYNKYTNTNKKGP